MQTLRALLNEKETMDETLSNYFSHRSFEGEVSSADMDMATRSGSIEHAHIFQLSQRAKDLETQVAYFKDRDVSLHLTDPATKQLRLLKQEERLHRSLDNYRDGDTVAGGFLFAYYASPEELEGQERMIQDLERENKSQRLTIGALKARMKVLEEVRDDALAQIEAANNSQRTVNQRVAVLEARLKAAEAEERERAAQLAGGGGGRSWASGSVDNYNINDDGTTRKPEAKAEAKAASPSLDIDAYLRGSKV